MKVFKFGGASVKDAQGIKNLAEIINKYKDDHPLVVVSAMGKMTNALENVARSFYLKKTDVFDRLNRVKNFHKSILDNLFEENHSVFYAVDNLFEEIEGDLEREPSLNYSYEYDQIVSIGEIVSTTIISNYLSSVGIDNIWLDARDVIKTDSKYQAARVNWDLTTGLVRKNVLRDKLTITQGFIGSTLENFSTTLGREGSDYSAAIFATILEVKKLVIWKDVPGVLHADPRYFKNPKKIEKLSYQEAIELAFYGASVIHPKTLQPLKSNSIPLEVRSFIKFDEKGTWISDDEVIDSNTAFFILKKNQTLLSISVSNLDFIVENHLSFIFSIFSNYNVKVNLIQNSAVSCYFALDVDNIKIQSLIDELSKHFSVKFDNDLDLLTVRHDKNGDIDHLLINKNVFLTQKNGTTTQVLYKS